MNQLPQISTALSNMIYMTESDSPVTLLDWPDVSDVAGLQKAIESNLKIPVNSQTIMDSTAFLADINRMANPSQPDMQAYVKQWNDLFDLLKKNARDIVIIKGGQIDLSILIASLGTDAQTILKTEATET
ncbi:MAG: nuclease A inhibitor family protein [Chitinophagaceae bacterium]